jgi:hypothetical protein
MYRVIVQPGTRLSLTSSFTQDVYYNGSGPQSGSLILHHSSILAKPGVVGGHLIVNAGNIDAAGTIAATVEIGGSIVLDRANSNAPNGMLTVLGDLVMAPSAVIVANCTLVSTCALFPQYQQSPMLILFA